MTSLSIADLEAVFEDDGPNWRHRLPQDFRDLIDTLRPGHGEIYVTSDAATSFTDNSSFVDVAGTFALADNAHDWTMDVNGQLKYTGLADRVCHIACSLSMLSSANNQIVHFVIAKSGTPIIPSVVHRKIGTGTDVGSTALHAFIAVSTGDYLTVQLKNTSWTAAQTVTLTTANLFVMDMPK